MAYDALILEIEDWLIGNALGDPDIVRLFQQLCERVQGAGVAIERASLNWPTLHPLFRAEQIMWRIDEGAKLYQFEHATEANPAWTDSPFNHALVRDLPRLRRRLEGPGALLDFPVLEELREQGYTDYLLTKAGFGIADFHGFESGGTGLLASWATRRAGGFADEDLQALTRIQRLFAVACRQAIQRRVMENIAVAYLGGTAGRMVLKGAIRRGDGERIPAVVWFSDLRDSTRLAQRMSDPDYLGLLNRYFEATAGPVTEAGGEVLDFIGDGVLAIFALADCGDATEAVRRAVSALDDATARCAAVNAERPEGWPEIRFGIGLAVGEVTFGNIGVPDRLAFSVIGRIVNMVQRIEAHTKQLGHPILATAEIAAAAPGGWRSMGACRLRDVEEEVELYARTPAAPVASAAE